MTNYIKYQCSVCRRIKDIEQDAVRLTLNKCTITKGCGGLLLALSSTVIQTPTLPVPGVEDWFPRGESRIPVPLPAQEEQVLISTSSTGALTVAVRSANPNSLPSTITMQLVQRRPESVAFQEYTFKPTTNSTVFSGRDSTGKILRIDQNAIDEGRVAVRVNGVVQQPTLSINTVTFAAPIAAGSIVNIRVQVEKDTIERNIIFTRNLDQSPSIARGAWSNVNVVQRAEGLGSDGRIGLTAWYLYSVDSVAGLTVGKLKIGFPGITLPMMFLLSNTPHRHVDRYLDFFIPMSNVTNDFLLEASSASSTSLSASRSALAEFYPPLILASSSFITPDPKETEASSSVITDAQTSVLVSSVSLGPK